MTLMKRLAAALVLLAAIIGSSSATAGDALCVRASGETPVGFYAMACQELP